MNQLTTKIIKDLESVKGSLLTFSDDIWNSIDHNDPKAMEEGVKFKRIYNEKLTAFDALAEELLALIQQFAQVQLESGERTGVNDQSRNHRIVQELNRDQPHNLDEDFTFKSPYGFILDGQATTGLTTWRRLYELTCRQLLQRNPQQFRALPDHSDFMTSRGHRAFSQNQCDLRSATRLEDGLYAEVNLSANSMCQNIRRLLQVFEIPEDRMQIFLQQDRVYQEDT